RSSSRRSSDGTARQLRVTVSASPPRWAVVGGQSTAATAATTAGLRERLPDPALGDQREARDAVPGVESLKSRCLQDEHGVVMLEDDPPDGNGARRFPESPHSLGPPAVGRLHRALAQCDRLVTGLSNELLELLVDDLVCA